MTHDSHEAELAAARELRLAQVTQLRATARRLRAEADQLDMLAAALGRMITGVNQDNSAQTIMMRLQTDVTRVQTHIKPHDDDFTLAGAAILQIAQDEAQRFNHNYIGTEHLLLGLTRQPGNTQTVLLALGVDIEEARRQVESIIGRGDKIVIGEIGLTPRAKKVLELARDETRRLQSHTIGPEHILLGLLREGEGIAAGVLESLGATLEKTRAAMLRFMQEHPDAESE